MIIVSFAAAFGLFALGVAIGVLSVLHVQKKARNSNK